MVKLVGTPPRLRRVPPIRVDVRRTGGSVFPRYVRLAALRYIALVALSL